MGSALFAYTLERRRRRSLCLQVQEDLSLRVLAPLRMAQSEIDAFVAAQQGWVARKRGELAVRGPGVRALPPEGTLLPLLGTHLALRRRTTGRGVQREAGVLWVCGEDAAALRALTRWYREQVRGAAQGLIETWSRRVGKSPSALVIREQKTRWGSCSRSGAIALNWRLGLGPPALLEYVVVHELCHLIHPHHRPVFWAEVGRVLPDYAERRRALRGFAATWFPQPDGGASPHQPTRDE